MDSTFSKALISEIRSLLKYFDSMAMGLHHKLSINLVKQGLGVLTIGWVTACLGAKIGSENGEQKQGAKTGSKNREQKSGAKIGSKNWEHKSGAKIGSKNREQNLGAKIGSKN